MILRVKDLDSSRGAYIVVYDQSLRWVDDKDSTAIIDLMLRVKLHGVVARDAWCRRSCRNTCLANGVGVVCGDNSARQLLVDGEVALVRDPHLDGVSRLGVNRILDVLEGD